MHKKIIKLPWQVARDSVTTKYVVVSYAATSKMLSFSSRINLYEGIKFSDVTFFEVENFPI